MSRVYETPGVIRFTQGVIDGTVVEQHRTGDWKKTAGLRIRTETDMASNLKIRHVHRNPGRTIKKEKKADMAVWDAKSRYNGIMGGTGPAGTTPFPAVTEEYPRLI
jgi:hypothetical protein